MYVKQHWIIWVTKTVEGWMESVYSDVRTKENEVYRVAA